MVRAEPTHSATHAVIRRPRALIVGLSIVVLTVAILQTAVVPVLGVIADQLDASTVAVSWAVTANLLAAAAATPLIGRLADLHSKKRVLLWVLVVVLVGSVSGCIHVVAALLIVGRILQAASFALYPIGVAILREELTEDRMVSAMSVLSATLGFGGGTGLVVVGLLVDHGANYHRVFWLTTAFTIVVIAIVVFVVPTRPRSATGSIDWLGADRASRPDCRRSCWRSPRVNTWGWTSLRTLATAAAFGILVTVGWWLWERRAEQPLVSTTMLSRRPIMLTNLATIFVGMGLVLRVPRPDAVRPDPAVRQRDTVSAPRSSRPASSTCCPAPSPDFVVALVSGRFIDRFGARPVLLIAAAAGITGFLFVAFAHSAPWQVIVASILANAYISLGYGALPALVVSEVTEGETGVATGMNAIARTIGSSIAAALVAVLLGRTATGTSVPAESSFVVIFIGGAVTGALAMVLIALSRVKARQRFR